MNKKKKKFLINQKTIFIITHSQAKTIAIIFILLRNVVSEKLSICLDAARKIDRLMKCVPSLSKLSK